MGCLLLTLIIASVGIIISFPIGVVLALGRQSDLRVIKLFSTIFIEFIRAVPLITILFMASFVLPLFLESGTNFDKLLRALIGIALFRLLILQKLYEEASRQFQKANMKLLMLLDSVIFKKMRSLFCLKH